MTRRYNSCRELGQKMDSEGGLAEMLYGYGLSVEDLPDDMPATIREQVEFLLTAQEAHDNVQSYLYEQAEAGSQPGDWDYDEGSEFD